MANVYNQLNRIDKAEEYYLKCIKTNEDYDVAAYRALSRLYAQQEQYEKAIALSKELISKYDGFDSDYLRLADFIKKLNTKSIDLN
jgi:tetratricopeptide (TPR) repeat protein